jgi:hypothetical protein
MRVDLEDLVDEQTGLLVEVPDGAADQNLGAEIGEGVPASQAAMSVYGECQ